MDIRQFPLYVLTITLGIAGCDAPTAPLLGFGAERARDGRLEIEVGWRSGADGTRLSGTLHLPADGVGHGAIVQHFGSNAWTRDPFNPFISRALHDGFGVLTYDKRGAGRSGGECCPWREPGYFDLLAGDLIGAVRLLAGHTRIDPERIGLYGVSQGGWVVPLAAVDAPTEVAFTIIASGPAVSVDEELLFSDLTGDARCEPTGRPIEEIEPLLDEVVPSHFDPRPTIADMRKPGLWQYCEDDTSVPVERSVGVLDSIAGETGAPFAVQRFPDCNHQFVEGGGMCVGQGERVDWVTPLLQWLELVPVGPE